jgi:TP901-1 family phage major tail protein
MAKQLGRTLLVRIGDGATPTEAFGVLCGLTTKTITINNTEIDVTTADCVTPGGVLWTQVLAGAKRVSVSGEGLFTDETTELRANTVAMSASAVAKFEIVVPAFGTFAGSFFLSTLDFGGAQDGGVTYSVALASSGPVTFTAAP